MKILEIIGSLLPTGGGEVFSVNICKEFNKISDLKVVILNREHNQHFEDVLVEDNIDYVFLDKCKHLDLKNSSQLAKIICDFRPDAIHTENNALISTYIALKFYCKIKIPVFHTMHLAPKDECSNFLVRILYKNILKKDTFIPVAITESLRDESLKFYHSKYIPVVRNGIDTTPFNKENALELEKRKYDIVVVARFTYQKNHEFLVKTLSQVHLQKPDLKVAFVGDGSLFDETKTLARNLNANFIDFLGAIDNPSSIVKNSKIIALGSRFEANPLSLLEGLAAGCIVVSSNVGGIANIISSENGFLYNCNDEDKFIEYILEVLNHISKYQTMSENNKIYGLNYSMEKCALQYYKIFEEFLNQKEHIK